MSEPISYGRSIPRPVKIEVFDDFRPYKLRALKALNASVFILEKSFIPLMVCTNLYAYMGNMNVHNGKYPIIKDLSLINIIINNNGGFNFSLLSFDIAEFILSPGHYIRNATTSLGSTTIPGFQYSKELYNPFAPPVYYGRGMEAPEPILFNIPETSIDTGAILIYLEV